MKTLNFKTNMKCGGCIAAVTPVLDELAGLDNWKVDLQSEDRLLTITSQVDAGEISDALRAAGYEAVLAN